VWYRRGGIGGEKTRESGGTEKGGGGRENMGGARKCFSRLSRTKTIFKPNQERGEGTGGGKSKAKMKREKLRVKKKKELIELGGIGGTLRISC